MDDILHILDILLERAEAALVLLSVQRTKLLLELSEIEDRVQLVRNCRDDYKPMEFSTAVDLYASENWHQAQMVRVKTINKKLSALDMEITQAKTQYKETLAKHLSAQAIAKQAANQAQIQKEDADAEVQLQIFQYRKI